MLNCGNSFYYVTLPRGACSRAGSEPWQCNACVAPRTAVLACTRALSLSCMPPAPLCACAGLPEAKYERCAAVLAALKAGAPIPEEAPAAAAVAAPAAAATAAADAPAGDAAAAAATPAQPGNQVRCWRSPHAVRAAACVQHVAHICCGCMPRCRPWQGLGAMLKNIADKAAHDTMMLGDAIKAKAAHDMQQFGGGGAAKPT